MATRTPTLAQLAARERFAEMARSGALNRKRKASAKKKAAAVPLANPRKKTVSQKISQLVHEGYPQRQAVAVALNEQRAGKVKRNPAKKKPVRMVHAYALVCMHPEPHTVALVDTLAHAKEIARYYSDRHNVQVAIRSIDVHAAHFIP